MQSYRLRGSEAGGRWSVPVKVRCPGSPFLSPEQARPSLALSHSFASK